MEGLENNDTTDSNRNEIKVCKKFNNWHTEQGSNCQHSFFQGQCSRRAIHDSGGGQKERGGLDVFMMDNGRHWFWREIELAEGCLID